MKSLSDILMSLIAFLNMMELLNATGSDNFVLG